MPFAIVGMVNFTAPIGTLTLDSAGHVYGATQQGGAANAGTVFVIVP